MYPRRPVTLDLDMHMVGCFCFMLREEGFAPPIHSWDKGLGTGRSCNNESRQSKCPLIPEDAIHLYELPSSVYQMKR